MIPSARPTILPVAIIILPWKLENLVDQYENFRFCLLKISLYTTRDKRWQLKLEHKESRN